MLNNKLPNSMVSNRENIFDLAKKWDPSSYIKTESPEVLSVQSLNDIPHNLFIPIGPILSTMSLNFKLYSQANKPYSLSIPLGNNKDIRDRAQALADKYCEAHPKEAYISQYNRWNLIPVKNIMVLKNILSIPEEAANYTKAINELPNTFKNELGYINVDATADIPNNFCKAKTLGLPISVISKLTSFGIESVDHTMQPIQIVYMKQAVAGTYAVELSNQPNPLTADLLPYILVPTFSAYEEIQESEEFNIAVNKLLDMIENGNSPVRFNNVQKELNTNPALSSSVNNINANNEIVVESTGAFV